MVAPGVDVVGTELEPEVDGPVGALEVELPVDVVDPV